MELKELKKNMSKLSYYDMDNFNSDVADYVAAIKSGRMMCVIHSVSRSGMSRTISFHSCQNRSERSYYRQYIGLFVSLGFRRKDDHFIIGGCGMNMIFHTNYTIMHQLKSLGYITKEECEHLCQQTPSTFY